MFGDQLFGGAQQPFSTVYTLCAFFSTANHAAKLRVSN
jgi:hypothetical protein